MSLTTLPVAIVLANLGVHLLADSMLVVVNPSALVWDGLLLRVGPCVGVITLSMTFLKVQLESVTSLKLIHDQMSDLHHRGNHLYKCRQWDRMQCLFRSIHEKMFSLVYIRCGTEVLVNMKMSTVTLLYEELENCPSLYGTSNDLT